MNLADFRRAGHWPSLLCASVYFGLSCTVWVLLGALGNVLAAEFRLSAAEKGLMVALPLLGGAVLRIGMGLLADRVGPRRTALIGLAATALPLLLRGLWVRRFEQLLVVGLLLGVPGASFAAALPMASRWYPPHYQGLALGIAGAGNCGTAVATFLAPRLAMTCTWRGVFALAAIPVAAAWLLIWRVARDAPDRPPARRLGEYAAPLKTRDAWWFCVLYSVTFGGVVGLASFLSIFFHDQYGLTAVRAGNLATLCALAGSLIRPLGGYLADQFGGIRVLLRLYAGVAIVMGGMTVLPSLEWAMVLLVVGMSWLGMGNGAVFQLVPLRYPHAIGVMSGLVGAAGGLGGFLIPSLLGGLKGMTGSFAGGFLALGTAGLTCAGILAAVSPVWEREFLGRGRLAAKPAS
jgi:NNP family nitrate/nitrite transporter-like MFS transporter